MRLIDADVIEKFLDDFADSCGNHQKAVLREVKYALGHMPTIEAVPTEFHDKCQQIEIQKRFKLEEDYRSMEQTVDKLIKALAEAEPIRHGRWKLRAINSWSGKWYCASCSECGKLTPDGRSIRELPIWNYCPNCGADMRGEQDE